MPLSFPSHQGLIAPLWRRWPRYFDMPALFVGSAMPDVVDGLIGAYRGHLGQGIGHSLAGLFLLCLPLGVVLWFGLHGLVRLAPAPSGNHFLFRAWRHGVASMHDALPPGAFKRHWRFVMVSLLIGAFSHLFFDLISHGGFRWLYPWHPNIRIFPDWWHTVWARLPVPGYRKPYPIGPHLIVWIALGVIGAVILFYPVVKRRKHR